MLLTEMPSSLPRPDLADELRRVDLAELLAGHRRELVHELLLSGVERPTLAGQLVDDLVGDRVEDLVRVAAELRERLARELVAGATGRERSSAHQREQAGGNETDDRHARIRIPLR
jgi:hypothetical protein